MAGLMAVGCSSNKRMAYDDTYYSPYNHPGRHYTSSSGSSTSGISSNATYDYQAY